MKRVCRIQGDGKTKDVSREGWIDLLNTGTAETIVELIQALIPLGLQAVEEALRAEVKRLAGPRHSRTGRRPGHVRWSQERGSASLLDQKLPITYTRVRDRRRNQEVPLATYQRLQRPRRADAGLFRKVLLGCCLSRQGPSGR